jgi:hypothetical protein
VMTVFTLPSYPYVFKVIRDQIARVEGHRPRRRSRQSTGSSSTTTASADDRHPRVLGRRVSARALIRRARAPS